MTLSLKTLALALIAVFAPAAPVVATVMLLTFMDLAFGLGASKKQGIPITSNGLKRTVVKTAVYLTGTLTAFLVEQYLTPIELPIMKMVTGLIGMTELKSVLENLDIISGGSFFKAVVDSLNQPSPTKGDPNAPSQGPQSPPTLPPAA